MYRYRSYFLAVLGMAALVGSVRADYIQSFAYTDRGVYTGTFARYTSLGDATGAVNPVPGSTFTLSATDLSMFFSRDVASGIGANYDPLVQGAGGQTAQFLNQWFYSTTPTPGVGNPNNTTNPFIQFDNITGSSVTSQKGFWTDSNLNQFQLQVTGQHAFSTPGDPSGDPDIARFQANGVNTPATNPNGLGDWVSYDLNLTFGGLNGVLDSGIAPGFYRADGDPTSISGTFTGIFTMNDDPTGIYRVDLTITEGNTYGFANQGLLDPSNPYLSSTFGSAQIGVSAVPAPPGVLLAGIGVAMGLFVRRSRARVAA
ncbi:MAG: hypothetical protein U0798_05605 [Gemmataceae bacterium]